MNHSFSQAAASAESAEEMLRTQVFLLQLVLEKHKVAKGWQELHQCAAHNHLAVMRNIAGTDCLQEAAYLTQCLDYADKLRSTRSAALGVEKYPPELVPALVEVGEVASGLGKGVVQDAGLEQPEFVVLLEAYQCAATAVLLGIDAAEIWPVPKQLWGSIYSKLKEWSK